MDLKKTMDDFRTQFDTHAKFVKENANKFIEKSATMKIDEIDDSWENKRKLIRLQIEILIHFFKYLDLVKRELEISVEELEEKLEELLTILSMENKRG